MLGTTTVNLAHSPDADDLVMWWPLTGQGHPDTGSFALPQVETRGIGFTLTARDVEELNKLAVSGGAPYDVTAVSAAAYPAIADRYAITRAGASFGEGYGPKLVVRRGSAIHSLADLGGDLIAVPGLNTTACMVLRLALPGAHLVEMLFSDIPGAVAAGDVDAGLLIHEAQLTFARDGLHAIEDMGRWWGAHTGGMPLPLGLNVVRRDLPDLDAVCEMLAASVQIAAREREASKGFLRRNNAGKPEWADDALLDRYLDMYVSPMTVDMGERGRAALAELYARAAAAGLIDAVPPLDIR